MIEAAVLLWSAGIYLPDYVASHPRRRHGLHDSHGSLTCCTVPYRTRDGPRHIGSPDRL